MGDRTNSWLVEDDLILANTVIEHIREVSTQIQAFDEVGDKLDRTAQACGFRWNAVLRERYVDELLLAKKERLMKIKNKKRKYWRN